MDHDLGVRFVGKTYHVNPRPSLGVMASVFPFDQHQQYDDDHGQNPSPEDASNGPTQVLQTIDLKPPEMGPELTEVEGAHDDRMHCEGDIIQPYRGLGRCLVSICILLADQGRIQECTRGDGVASKA